MNGIADVHLQGLCEIPGQLGALVVSESGAIIVSKGDFVNDSVTGTTILKLFKTASEIELPGSDCQAKRLCLYFENHVITVTASNKRIYIVKTARFDNN